MRNCLYSIWSLPHPCVTMIVSKRLLPGKSMQSAFPIFTARRYADVSLRAEWLLVGMQVHVWFVREYDWLRVDYSTCHCFNQTLCAYHQCSCTWDCSQKKDIVFRVRVLAIKSARESTAPLLSYSLVFVWIASCNYYACDGFHFNWN